MLEFAKLEREILSLDLKSRARLAARLLESLDELSDEENEKLWAEEAVRRDRELDAGDAVSIPLDDVMREARSHIS
jgi:hypothetical protein